MKSNILQLPELITHTTLCYIHSGITGPPNVQHLWTIYNNPREESRTSEMQLTYRSTHRQWIHNLAPIAQVKIWNTNIQSGLNWRVSPLTFKLHSKFMHISNYSTTLQSQGIFVTNDINLSNTQNHNSKTDTVNYVALAAYKDD